MDHYQTLGVAKTATPDEIKKAYRKLASQHHPDKGGDTATFQKIQTAYDTLSDPSKRQQYDNPAPQGFNGFPGGFHFGGTGFEDLFEMFNRQQQRRPQQQTYRTTVLVTMKQAYYGEEHTIRLQTNTNTHMVSINVPKGINNGDQIRLDNVIDGASLIVEFRVQPDLKYERRGSDLYCNHSISVLDLIVGSEFEFTTISGKTLAVSVKPKTQPFMQLKIAGQGMPIPNSNQYGDQIILLKPFIPDIIDSRIIDSITESKTKE
jgi:DnaJ-class molecular chaperone